MTKRNSWIDRLTGKARIAQIEAALVLKDSELYHLEKRLQRAESWLVLLAQCTAHQAGGSQTAIRSGGFRWDVRKVNESLGEP